MASMSTLNSFAFVLLGLGMELLKVHVPGCSETGVLWLEFMGIIEGAIGAFFLVRNEVVLPVRQMIAQMSRSATEADSHEAIILRPPCLREYGPGTTKRSREADRMAA